MARRYFLTYFTLTSCLVAGQSPEYALQGGEVSLKTDVTGQPDGILWKHNGNKVVEFNGREEQVYKPFENRVTVDWVSAGIQMTDLRFEDSGEYELELELNKKLQRFFYRLEVIDKIAKPTISCEINDDSIGNISGKLLCSAKPGRLKSLKKLEWRSHGSVQPGPEFNIPLGGEHNEEEYSCTVSNPRSSETATFTAKDCYPVKSSSVGLTAGLVSFFCILLGGLLGIVLYCKLRHKACFAKDDPEKQSRVVPKKAVSGEDEKKAERSERKCVLPNRESTLRSNQPLRNLNQAVSGEDEKKAERSEKERLLHHSESTLPSNQSLHLNQDHNMDNQEDDMQQKGDIKELIKYHERNNSGRIYGSQRVQKPRDFFPKTKKKGSKKTASPRSPPHLGDEDADREHLGEKIQATNSEEAEPNPAGVSDVPSEETQSDLEPSVPEQTEKNSDQHEKTASPPSPRHNETASSPASSPDLNNLGDEDADQNRENLEREIPQGKLTDSEKAGPDPADLSGVLSEESSVPEQTDHIIDNQEDDSPKKGNTTDEHEKTMSPPFPPNNVGAEDADQHGELAEDETPQVHNSDSEKEDPDTAVVTDVPSEETPSDLESSVPEHAEPEKKEDKAEEKQSAPASTETFSPAQPPEDSTFEHKEDANSQVTKETKEKNVRESDSSGEEERNESDDSTKDEQSPTLPEHKGLETTLHEQDVKASEEETHTSQDNKQEVSETVQPVSKDGNTTESVGDCKETDKEPDLYLATSQPSQSPTPSNTFQETPDTAGAEPDQAEEELEGHDKSKVQSDKDKGEVVEDKHEVECGLKEEKPGHESLSEDEEEQKKDTVVA